MDLSTIAGRLANDEYSSVAQFRLDVQTTFSNLLIFNNDPEETRHTVPNPREAAVTLLDVFQTQYVDYDHGCAGEEAMDLAAKQFCRKKLEALLAHRKTEPKGKVRTCGPFVVPVLSLGLPDYEAKVAKPMDLCHVATTLNTDGYRTVEEFESDVVLTFTNALTHGKTIAYEDPDTNVQCPVDQLAKAGLVVWRLSAK